MLQLLSYGFSLLMVWMSAVRLVRCGRVALARSQPYFDLVKLAVFKLIQQQISQAGDNPDDPDFKAISPTVARIRYRYQGRVYHAYVPYITGRPSLTNRRIMLGQIREGKSDNVDLQLQPGVKVLFTPDQLGGVSALVLNSILDTSTNKHRCEIIDQL